MIVVLTQETHFKEGSSESSDHQFMIDWKSIGSDEIIDIYEKNDDSRAKDCQVHAVRGSRESCQRYQNDEYIGIKQARTTDLKIRLQADCAIYSCAYYSRQNFSSVMSM